MRSRNMLSDIIASISYVSNAHVPDVVDGSVNKNSLHYLKSSLVRCRFFSSQTGKVILSSGKCYFHDFRGIIECISDSDNLQYQVSVTLTSGEQVNEATGELCLFTFKFCVFRMSIFFLLWMHDCHRINCGFIWWSFTPNPVTFRVLIP